MKQVPDDDEDVVLELIVDEAAHGPVRLACPLEERVGDGHRCVHAVAREDLVEGDRCGAVMEGRQWKRSRGWG